MTSDDQSRPGGIDPPARRPDPVGDLEAAGRLLDTPLLGEDPPPAAPVPEVKPLVWEHVVRPLDGTPAGGLPRIPPPVAPSVPAETGAAATLPAAGGVAAAPRGPADVVGDRSHDLGADGVVDERTTDHVTSEIDRLAFVPDTTPTDPAGEVPPGGDPTGDILIVEATPTVPLATTPGLPGVGPSLPPSAPSPSRADVPAGGVPAAGATVTPADAARRPAPPRRTYTDLASDLRPASRPRRRRRVLSRLMTMLVLVGLVGAGLVAARQYLLEPQWADDIAPLADEVAAARGLEFIEAVPVVEQTPTVYSMMLMGSVFDVSEATIDDTAGEWRALGLLNGVLDAATIGRTALPDQPAFFDPATGTVNVVNGLGPELRGFAIQRALGMALLDQHYAWSTLLAGEPLSVVTGTRMVVEADALATAQSLVTEAERVAIATQTTDLFARLEVPPSPSPYATAVLSRLGVAMWPWFRELADGDRVALLTGIRLTDASVLDLRRFAAVAPAPGAAAPTTLAGRPLPLDEAGATGTRGMLFWYHVLAGRLDSDLAWRAALSWQDDSLSVERTAGRVCVSALFETDAVGGQLARAAFEQWSAASPSPVTLLVTDRAADPSTGEPTGLQISVQVCDAGPSVNAHDGRSRLLLGGAALRAEQFVRLLEADETLARAQAACVVYGPDAVTVADERGVLDGLDGWAAPSTHPPLDPTAPCGSTTESAPAP